jgi:hypothetical protein
MKFSTNVSRQPNPGFESDENCSKSTIQVSPGLEALEILGSGEREVLECQTQLFSFLSLLTFLSLFISPSVFNK